jgi:tRNA A37 threonylcarbamoyladenosine dehydratase
MKIHYVFLVVGAGGTGGNFIKEFVRFITNFTSDKVKIDVILIDGDTVEKKNCDRQPYLLSDINQNKALVLANAIGDTYGYDVYAFSKYLEEPKQLSTILKKFSNDVIPVIVGCVDNV